MTTKNTTFQAKLDEELRKYFQNAVRQAMDIGPKHDIVFFAEKIKTVRTEAAKSITELVNRDVVGADEIQNRNNEDFDDWTVCSTCDVILDDLTLPEYACICTRRNELRAEQRATLGIENE